MADVSGLVVEPSNELFFKGPFTDIVTSYIKLKNGNDYPLAFKVKTTAPKRYSVRPSGGILNGNDELQVVVMLQPFDYDPNKKEKHKFMIQSMKVPADISDSQNNMEELWKNANAGDIRDKKMICIHRYPGELSVEPNRITLKYSQDELSSMNFNLSNTSSDRVCFELNSSTDFVSLNPKSGVVGPGSVTRVVVSVTNTNFNWKDCKHHVTLRSAVTGDELDSPHSFSLQLPVIYSSNMTQSAIVRETHSTMASAPQSATKSRESEYLDEIARLKNENKALKESDIVYRRAALSETCVGPKGPVVAEGGTVIGTIAGIPIILFLILTLIIGLILGKYVL